MDLRGEQSKEEKRAVPERGWERGRVIHPPQGYSSSALLSKEELPRRVKDDLEAPHGVHQTASDLPWPPPFVAFRDAPFCLGYLHRWGRGARDLIRESVAPGSQDPEDAIRGSVGDGSKEASGKRRSGAQSGGPWTTLLTGENLFHGILRGLSGVVHREIDTAPAAREEVVPDATAEPGRARVSNKSLGDVSPRPDLPGTAAVSVEAILPRHASQRRSLPDALLNPRPRAGSARCPGRLSSVNACERWGWRKRWSRVGTESKLEDETSLEEDHPPVERADVRREKGAQR